MTAPDRRETLERETLAYLERETEFWKVRGSDSLRDQYAYAAQCVRFVQAINKGEIGVAHEAHRLDADLAVQVYLCADESRYAYAPDAITAYRQATGGTGDGK